MLCAAAQCDHCSRCAPDALLIVHVTESSLFSFVRCRSLLFHQLPRTSLQSITASTAAAAAHPALCGQPTAAAQSPPPLLFPVPLRMRTRRLLADRPNSVGTAVFAADSYTAMQGRTNKGQRPVAGWRSAGSWPLRLLLVTAAALLGECSVAAARSRRACWLRCNSVLC